MHVAYYFTYGDTVIFDFSNSYQVNMFYRIAVLKVFAKFTENHVRKSPFIKSF